MNINMYRMGIHGCDDSTYVDVALNDEELNLVKRICKMSEENSTYQCMPIMDIEKKELAQWTYLPKNESLK